ncbi:hypothetical protein [Streptomyces sp. NPDC046197]|uniref:hypothetical protein n=1 Tax=Streptomyces sp. NPDC046197 TaxID=3154337 RepID=UPI0033C7201C
MSTPGDSRIAQVLAMVGASAPAVARDEYEELYDEFAEEVLATGRIPGMSSVREDRSSAGILDGHVALGMGLTVVGEIAWKLMSVATDMAVERGLRDAASFLRRCLRGEREVSAQELADRITRAGLSTLVDAETLVLVVRLQAEALADHADRQPVDPDRA